MVFCTVVEPAISNGEAAAKVVAIRQIAEKKAVEIGLIVRSSPFYKCRLKLNFGKNKLRINVHNLDEKSKPELFFYLQ